MTALLGWVSPYLVRVISFIGGAGIIWHEVWVADSSEPLLVFVGLWLAGAPIADLLDKLRKMAQIESPELPEAPEVQPSERRRRRKR